MLTGIISPLNESQEFNSLIGGLEQGYQNQMVYGLSGSLSSYFMAGFGSFSPLLIITANFQQARKRAEDLKALLPDKEILIYPETESVYYNVIAQSKELLSQRLKVLHKLLHTPNVIVIASVEAVLKRLTPVKMFRESYLMFKIGDKLVLESMLSALTGVGYERVDMVEGPGHISLRGGILDVFPLTEDKPYRVEFFDNEVESIRVFNPETQRSTDTCNEIMIPPAGELVLDRETMNGATEKIKKEFLNFEKKLAKQGSIKAIETLKQKVNFCLEQTEQGIYFEGIELYLPFFYQEPALLVDYFGKNALIVLDEPVRIKEAVETRTKERADTQASLLEKGLILPTQTKYYLDSLYQLKESFWNKKIISLSLLPREPGFIQPQNIVNVSAKGIQGYTGRIEVLAEEIKNWRKKKYAIVILAATEDRADKIKDILRDYKIDTFYTSKIDKEIRPGNVVITKGVLESGFEYHQEKLIFLTDQEIFGQKKKATRRFKETGEGVKITNIEDLSFGDYIVHINHGIGKYLGIQKLNIGGFQKDYLLIKYAGEDKLYVPTEQVSLIQKYMGAEGKAPKLNKLGGNEWARTKNKVKESAQDMAKELLELYAAREEQAGFSFAADTVWQADFEDAFPYEETKDQVRAISEIKQDMENKKPMDRLLCGDVGYGKTEVAIRAAFKAVMDNKQVAVLVPTTILAQQHFNTFSQRFSGFPVTIDMLSRFRTAKQQKETVDRLNHGKVDIIIGTHRLVQGDVGFKDLGLVIVDEEQRFGVAHKEKLKTLKRNVDVLTLTATPIPRTLHMSMVGVRDISTLENPPEDRFPVQTYVMEFHPDIIKDAIQREIDRGGQVYFVHNRISDIAKAAQDLAKIVPDARIALGHGRMREDQLEKTVLDFISGKYDVFVCTTIIETGLDISNVNTIIVNEADRFGLSQLYQLRGRVGRSHRVAYAYFTYRREKILSEVAEKRLQAIREFTEFGSGFKIAVRDLEIRGAGNILGPEQHGHMMAVGFDLYCSLLENAVKELKGEDVKETPETSVEINISAYIDDDYVSDQAQKIDLYKKIMMIKEAADTTEVEQELEDRYGEIPPSVRNLLAIAQIRALASKIKVETVKQNNGFLIIKFWPEHNITGEALLELSRVYQDNISFSAAEPFEIRFKLESLKPENIVKTAEKILEKANNFVKILA